MDYSPTDRCVRQTSAHAHDSYDLDPQSGWICSKKNAFSYQHRKMLIMWICSKWVDKSVSMEAFLATCHFFLFRKFHGFPASSGRPRCNTGGRGAEAELVSDPLRVKQASLDWKNSLLASTSCGLIWNLGTPDIIVETLPDSESARASRSVDSEIRRLA